MVQELVSIIVPCYNGETYLQTFFESVLEQTYSKIELILVDDGSTDKTAEIARLYRKQFEQRKFALKYVYQENAGQAAAINTGLQMYTGEFLMWVDCDDILLPENVEHKVRYLREHPECELVICGSEKVCADNLDKVINSIVRSEKTDQATFFRDLIYEKNIMYGYSQGTVLVRTNAFRRAIPNNSIYVSREGQNWQLILPLMHTCKCGFLEEVLFRYVVRKDSHSHMERSYEEQQQRYENFEVLLVETINRITDMPEVVKQDWRQQIWFKYAEKKIILAYNNHDRTNARQIKEEIKRRNLKKTFRCTYLYWVCLRIKVKIYKIVRHSRNNRA